MTMLGWVNWVDGGGVVLGGSAGPETLPPSHLQQVDVSDEAWAWWADGPDPYVTVDFGTPRPVGALSLLGIGADMTPVTMRVRASNAGVGMTDGVVLDSGLVSAHCAPGIAVARTGMAIHLPAAETTARCWRIDLPGTGKLRAGRLFLGPIHRFLAGAAYNWERVYNDPSTQVRAPGAQLRSWSLPQWRTFQVDLPKLTRAEADSVALEVQRAAGRTGDVLLIADERQAPLSPYAVWGVMSASSVKQVRSQRFSWSIKVEERG